MSNNFSMCQAGRSFIKSLPKEEQERIKTLAEQKGFCPWAYYDAKKDSKWGMFKVQNGISFVKSFPQKEREQLEIALDELLTNEQLVRQNAVVNVERRFTELYINFGPQDANMGKLGDCSHAGISRVSV